MRLECCVNTTKLFETADDALAVFPNDAELLYLKATALIAQHKFKLGLMVLDTVLEINPTHERALGLVAKVRETYKQDL